MNYPAFDWINRSMNTDHAGRAYWVSKEGASLPGEASPQNAAPVEGRQQS